MDEPRKQALEQLIADGGPVPAVIEPARPAATGSEVGAGGEERLVLASRFAWRDDDGNLEVASAGDTVKVDSDTAKRGEELGVLAPMDEAGKGAQEAGTLEELAEEAGLDLAPGAEEGQDDQGKAIVDAPGVEEEQAAKSPKRGK